MSYVLGNTRKISRADTVGTPAQTKRASVYTNDQQGGAAFVPVKHPLSH